MAQILRATTTFHAAVKGSTPRQVVEGQLLLDNDPIVKGRESLFKPAHEAVEGADPIEVATHLEGELSDAHAKIAELLEQLAAAEGVRDDALDRVVELEAELETRIAGTAMETNGPAGEAERINDDGTTTVTAPGEPLPPVENDGDSEESPDVEPPVEQATDAPDEQRTTKAKGKGK